MHTRIAAVIEDSGLTRTAFGQRINLSQPMVSRLALGTTNPSDRTIADICREFGVNEEWLRSGIGPMYYERSREDELPRAALARFIGEMILSLPPEALDELTRTLRQLQPEGGDFPYTLE